MQYTSENLEKVLELHPHVPQATRGVWKFRGRIPDKYLVPGARRYGAKGKISFTTRVSPDVHAILKQHGKATAFIEEAVREKAEREHA